jgi:hypothetical protein
MQQQHIFIQQSILGIDNNAKTVKGQAQRFMTAIIYLAPSDSSGENLCAMAKVARCDVPCLFTAGRGAMSPVQDARMKKTRFFLDDQERFMQQMALEIYRANIKAQRADMTLLVRPNGTSDIRWERIPVVVTPWLAERIGVAAGTYRNIMAVFPLVQFYDYTKIANRRDIPSNYDLTFSYSGVPEFLPHVQRAVGKGMRVAVVFRNREMVDKMLADGSKFIDLPVVDGDESDIRHLDPQGCVVALYAKGRAKKDDSGFVVG